jgi:hypothetical protein
MTADLLHIGTAAHQERLALVSTRNVSRRPILLQPRYSLNPLARNEPLVAGQKS